MRAMSSEQRRTTSEKWKWRRREAIIRDDYTCQECGAQGGPEGDANLEVHHITPAAEGGSDSLENLETLCKDCHRSGRENPGWFEQEYGTDDFLAALEDEDGVAGTSALAEAVGCSSRHALNRLRELEDVGKVSSKDVGRSLVWMLADESE
jgi:hypothetical protein